MSGLNAVGAGTGVARQVAGLDGALESVLKASTGAAGGIDHAKMGAEVARIARTNPEQAAALTQRIEAGLGPVDIQSFRNGVVRGAGPVDTAALAAKRREVALDVTQITLDVVGIFEPTPFADGANTLISLGRGDLLGAGLSALGMVPYLGDAAKLGKLGHWAKSVSNAIELAKTDSTLAKTLRPGLEKLNDALQAIPAAALDKLPASAKQTLQRMQRSLDEALGGLGRAESSFIPSRTAPTGALDGTPGGIRATNKPNAAADFKRGIARENEAADVLASKGYKVEQGPVLSDADRIRDGIKPGKNPDYRIEGRIFDGYAPQTPTAAGVYDGILDKVAKGQTHRIVLNLGDTNVRPGDIQKLLRESPIAGLQEVVIVDAVRAVHKSFP